MAISLDGVMLPMKDGNRQEKREQNKADGKRTRDPAGCQEASCGTLSFYDDQGERFSTMIQSDLFNNGWKLLSVIYCAEVTEAGTGHVIQFPVQKDNLE